MSKLPLVREDPTLVDGSEARVGHQLVHLGDQRQKLASKVQRTRTGAGEEQILMLNHFSYSGGHLDTTFSLW